MRLVVFEGTTEEFKAVEHLFHEGGVVSSQVPSTDGEADVGIASDGSDYPRHMDVMRQIVSRLPIPRGQQQFFHALYEAGDTWLKSSQLAEKMGRPLDMTGALGRRIAGTPGVHVPKGFTWLSYIVSIRKQDGEWAYKLRPEFRQIIEEKGLVGGLS